MKYWYESKTMWLNIAVGLSVLTGALVEFLPYLDGVVPAAVYKWSLFLSSMANVGLRKVTTTGIK